MPSWRCRTCGGEYADPQPDGSRYFHVCPPLSEAEARGQGRPPTDPRGRPHARDELRDERPASTGVYDREGRIVRPDPPRPSLEGRGRDLLEE